MIPSEKTFVEWAMKEDMELTEQEAGLILGYVLGHGYGVCLDATDTKVFSEGIISIFFIIILPFFF